MNDMERRRLDLLNRRFRNMVNEAYSDYRKKIEEIIGKEEEKADNLDEYFPSSPLAESIHDGIDELEERLETIEEAVDMIMEE